MNTQERTETLGRLEMALVGGLAGLSFWVLVDVLPDRLADLPRLYLFLAALATVFFNGWLAMSGPLAVLRAALSSLALALPLAGLITWASLRFDTIDGFFDTGHPAVSIAILGFVPLPFLIAGARASGWAHYPTLFSHSWNIVVRYAAAWLFVGVIWGVLMLSDALLKLVGIEVIEWLIEQDAVPYLLTGVTLGVALAVVNELSDYVSPYLVLRLLRLILPVVLVVVVVFLAALPLRGLSHLFGDFSAAGTLLAMAMGAVTLITTALDADQARAVHTRMMRGACQALALLVPALAVLAGVAIWMRVQQYGWTPDRLAAATLAVLVLAYGVAYAVSVLLRGDWAARLRRSNITMALVASGVAVIWLTPLFSPQRVATADQVARFARGTTPAAKLDLWTMAHDWGRAGQAGVMQLAAMADHPEAAQMAQRVRDLEGAPSRYAFERRERSEKEADLVQELRAVLALRPEGAELAQGVLAGLRDWQLTEAIKACGHLTPAGNPGCVLLLAELSAYQEGTEAVLFTLNGHGGVHVQGLYPSAPGAPYDDRPPDFLRGASARRLDAGVIDAVLAGQFRLKPVPAQVLDVQGQELYFGR